MNLSGNQIQKNNMLKKIIILSYVTFLSTITMAQTWDQVWEKEGEAFRDTLVKPFFKKNNIFYTGEIKVVDTVARYKYDENSPRLIDFYTDYEMVKKDKDYGVHGTANYISFGINHLGKFTHFACENASKYQTVYCGFYRQGNIAKHIIDESNEVEYYPNGELMYKRMGDEVWDTVNVFKYPNGALNERIDFYPIDTFVSTNPKDCNVFRYARASDDSLIYKNEDFEKYGITWPRHISYRILDGKHEFGYKNHKIKMLGYYKNNLRDGEWVYYNEKGKLIRKEVFQEGKKVKCKPCGEVSNFVYLTLYSFSPNGRVGPVVGKYKGYDLSH
jgi:hypothetical protein